MWREDIEEWEKEQARLFADLETALGAEVSGLKSHAAAIGRHEENVLRHEHLLADLDHSKRPGATEIEARMAGTHSDEAAKHETMRAAHERIKRHHHRAMARLAVVLKALSQEA
ncbi:MAG TPA: hypothetical protein VMR25_24710 [Planctomycetaceae bacterium]|jgi:hypothetical protein|nr:hypothetical protein [Planctomycetaceae bacterium]